MDNFVILKTNTLLFNRLFKGIVRPRLKINPLEEYIISIDLKEITVERFMKTIGETLEYFSIPRTWAEKSYCLVLECLLPEPDINPFRDIPYKEIEERCLGILGEDEV